MIQKPTGTFPLTAITMVLLALAIAFIISRLASGQIGAGYYRINANGASVEKQTVEPRSIAAQEADLRANAVTEREALTDDEARAAFDRELDERIAGVRADMHFSFSRTIGIWIAAFLTLAILSFLWRDNPAYRLAESVFVGVSAAYWMVFAFHAQVIPNLIARLFPHFNKAVFSPYTPLDDTAEALAQRNSFAYLIDYESAVGSAQTAPWWQLMDLWYWIPMVLGILLLWRLMPKGQWVSRYTIAYVMGATAGIKMFGFLTADFVSQIKNAIQPIYVPVYVLNEQTGQMAFNFGQTFYQSVMLNSVLLVSTLCVLVYFFFSLEHKGVVGKISRLGIWVLMITFGAGFGYTVMGRIALLVGRFEFLIKDWMGYTPVG